MGPSYVEEVQQEEEEEEGSRSLQESQTSLSFVLSFGTPTHGVNAG